jgi:hypothetical protein
MTIQAYLIRTDRKLVLIAANARSKARRDRALREVPVTIPPETRHEAMTS